MSYDSTLHAKAVSLTKLAYEMTAASGSGHPTSAASLAHIVSVLMYDVMRYEPTNPTHPSSDRLMLSEGHAVPIVYAACADQGVYIGKGIGLDKVNELRAMTREDTLTLREMNSVVDGHPNPVEGFPFFDAATGSLGQGLSMAAGIAAADKLDGVGKRVYTIMGDGESREGQIQEALEFIIDHQLKAVCPIFNCNVYAQTDKVSSCQSAEAIVRKLKAIGYDVVDVNGHSPSELKKAFDLHAEHQADAASAPVAIVARTEKGWGSPSQQGNGHHGAPAKGNALTLALSELDTTGRQAGATADTPLKIGMLPAAKPAPAKIREPMTFEQALAAFGQEDALSKGKMATRKAYGVGLRSLGYTRSDIVALDCDVQGSTGAADFAKDDKVNARFFEGRIAEQNMISAAVGLSAAKKVPFCSTFGKFFVRAYDQIEIAVNSGANIKLAGSHAGISLGADGPSQMAVTDVPFFRGFTTMTHKDGRPGFYVLTPSDAFSAYGLLHEMAAYNGPCYMRTLRPDTEFLYSSDTEFKLGGFETLIEGRDLLICASGYMVHQANQVLEKLDAQGVDATIVDMYSLPFDGDALLDLANQNNGMVLTLEDNYGGGMGSAVADVMAESGDGFTVKQMHVTKLAKSGKTPDDLMAYCGLDVDSITAAALNMLAITV